MSTIAKLEVKSGPARNSAISVAGRLKSAGPTALLLSVSLLGLGSTSASAQSLKRIVVDQQTSTAPTKRFTLPGMGADVQHDAAPPTGTMNYPYGMAVDTLGNLYVANVFGGVNIYSATNNFKLANTITTGTSFPAAVALNSAGNIYIANNGGNDITIYDEVLTQIGTISDATLESPTNLCIDGADDIWALDSAGVLHLYLDKGTPAGSVTTGGTAIGTWGPNISVWGVPNGPGKYLEIFQNVGEALHNGPAIANEIIDGLPEAGGEAEDSSGHLYLTNINTNQVQIYEDGGLFQIAAFTTPAAPYGIAVDSVHKRIFVSLTTSNEVAVYSTVAPYKLLRIIK